MNEHLIEAAASKHASIDDYGQVVFPGGEWDKFVAALSTPQADKVPAAEGAIIFPNPVDIVAAMSQQAKARTSAENIADVLAALAAAWNVTPPAKLPQYAQPVEQRYCNKCGYFGPFQLHPRPNGTGQCDYMSTPAPQPARADDEYQRGFADGAGIYRANAVKAIKEHQPARAGAVEVAELLAMAQEDGCDTLTDYVAALKQSSATYFAERNSARDAYRKHRDESEARGKLINIVLGLVGAEPGANVVHAVAAKLAAATTAATGGKGGA